MSDAVLPDVARNFISDMEPAMLLVTPERSLVRAPVTDAVRAPGGSASVGVLMSLVDIGASDPALVASHPDWTATQDMSVHGAGWLDEGPVVVDSRLVRAGHKVVVVTADIYDGRGIEDLDVLRAAIDGEDAGCAPTLAGRGLVTFARLPRTAARGIGDYVPSQWLGRLRHRPVIGLDDATMYERMGLRVLDGAPGRVELERTPYVTNSIGTINGGAQAVLAQVAAEQLRPGRAAVDMQAHYLSQLKVGPAQASATLLRDSGDHSVVSVRLVDAGNADQVLTLATVTLRARG